jgi:hypothetical protein
MEFALLIYGNEKSWTNASEQERREMYAQHERFMKMLQDRGAIRGGAELDATTTARTIRHGGDDLSVTDGPFAETAEQFGGFYLIEAADIEEAVAIGKELPAAVVEVRPLVPTPESGS